MTIISTLIGLGMAGLGHRGMYAVEPLPDDGMTLPPRKRHRSEPGQALANVSRNHPDYGCTVEEHEARKAARIAGDRA